MERDNRDVVRRFYELVWNRWDREAAADIVAADIRFRGSLGTHADGLAGFLRYVDAVRGAFPDFHNQVDELIEAGDTVVARLTCSGTLQGPLFGVAGNGHRITYAAIAILRLQDDRIRDAWVVGDTQELWLLGALPPPPTRSARNTAGSGPRAVTPATAAPQAGRVSENPTTVQAGPSGPAAAGPSPP